MPDEISDLTAQIVCAYLEAKPVSPRDVPALSGEVHAALKQVSVDGPSATVAESKQSGAPNVDVRRSVFADHLVCLDCGNRAVMMKRHLRDAHGLTPGDYRTKWGLPATYPMTASNYVK